MELGIKNRKALFGVALLILTVSIVKNIFLFVQVLRKNTATFMVQDNIAIIIEIVFYMILFFVINNVRWRIGWIILVLNKLLNMLAVSEFAVNNILLQIFAVLLAAILLTIAALNFYKSKKVIFN